MSDQVILVNEQDEVLGVMDKVKAHRGIAQLHRAISVFLFDEKGNVLLQQRSAKKIVGAGQWANTCCGNVRPGESYEACAYRRLREELGIIDVTLIPVAKFVYFAECNEEFSEREMDQVFVGFFSGQVKPNPEEVRTTAWRDWQTFLRQMATTQTGTHQIAPWLLEMYKRGLLDQVTRKDIYADS